MKEELQRRVIGLVEGKLAGMSDHGRREIAKWLGHTHGTHAPMVRSSAELSIALDRVAKHLGADTVTQIKAISTPRNYQQISTAILFALLATDSKKPEASL